MIKCCIKCLKLIQIVMNYFQRLCFCDYRWLWILVIIITIITTKAERNSFSDFFDKNIVNNTDYYDRESINKSKTEQILSNSTQRTVSRPSTVLKQLWSSASKSWNNSNDNNSNNNNNSQSFAVKLREFLFRPTKWSSDIVPSIPLNLQMSSDAIKLSSHLKEGTKSETKGDITVINGFSSSISYPPKDYKIVNRSESKLNSLDSVMTSSTPLLTTNENPTVISPTLLPLNTEVTLPIIDIRINATSLPLINDTVPTKIITTTATIVSSAEPEKRSGELFSTTFRSIQTNHGLTQKPKMSASELRRLAIKQRFGNTYKSFGTRITRTPPRVSIDNFLSVYKPTLKNQFFTETLKTRFNSKNENPVKTTKNITENSLLKPKLLNFNKSNEISIKNKINQKKDYLMSTETRNTLSSILLFPSRPTPMLKPKLSNNTIDFHNNGLKQNFLINSSNFSRNNSIEENAKNVMTDQIIDRRDDNQLIESISKNNLFGYRKKLFENLNDKNEFNKINISQISVKPTDGLQSESIINPELESEQIPLFLAEDYQSIPMDELMGAHKHYINQLKLNEQNMKYKNLPNPDLFKDQLNKPEEEEPKFTIKPINPQYFKNSKKVRPTLPNKVMKFDEMMRHLAAVMISINNLTPIGRSLSEKYKQFSSKIKFDLMNNKSKGPYARYYPPGPYDDVYDPDPVDVIYRRSDDEVSPENTETSDKIPNNYTINDRIDDLNNNNNSYAYNDYDEDGLIKKSYGYRVTVYRTPENGESNVTEEVLDDENHLNGNKSDDLSVSESSDQFSVTTDSNNNGTEYLMTSASNLLRGESQSGIKGNAKGVDYKRNKYNRQKGSHAREEVSANKSKKVDTHDRIANNERALKERTIIEFFEREHILDTAYNKDKLGLDKTDKHNSNDDQHTSGSMTSPTNAPEESITTNGSLNAGEVHVFSNSERNHVTNGETFDTIFPEHDRKLKHKNNAHKYKGWKERGYKIITETEFVDRGHKMDTGFKKHINGSKEHIKEHNAGDVTKADSRKYNKNIKNINKNFEALYGKRVKSPKKNYENGSKDKVLMNADDYHKYYYNNGINSGESQVTEEHKPYDSTEQTSEQSLIEGMSTTGDTTQEDSKTEENTTENKATEKTTSEKTFTEDDVSNGFSTDNFHPPPVDTDNYWRPITSSVIPLRNTNEYYPKVKNYNKVNYNYNDYNNNVYPNDNTNENYYPNFGNVVNNIIDNKGFPTITSEIYGSGNNPYSMPLVSEVVPYPNTKNIGINPNVPHYYNNQQYFYQPIPKSIVNTNSQQNDYSIENKNNIKYKHLNNNSSQTQNDINYNDIRFYNNFHPNRTYFGPTFDIYREPQLTPNYPPMMEMAPTAEAPLPPTDQPYYDYQIYSSVDPSSNYLDNVPKDRPLFGLIGDETKNIPKMSQKFNSLNKEQTKTRFNKNGKTHPLDKDLSNNNFYKHTLTTPKPLPHIENQLNYVKPIKINTRIPRPVPKTKLKQKTSKKKTKNSVLLPTRPLMAPPIDGLYLNTNQFQTLLNPISNFPFHLKFPLSFQSTALPPAHMPVSYNSQFPESDNRPIAILHPNKMLTITTTSLMRNKFGENFFNTKKMLNPFRFVINKDYSKDKKRETSKRLQRSTPFKLSLISQKLRKKRRNFKEILSVKNWLKSRF